MTQLAATTALQRAVSPDVLAFPGEPGWNDARRARNLTGNQRPAAVALPTTVEELVAAVEYARTIGLRVAVQGTSSGRGVRGRLDGMLLVDVSRLSSDSD